MSTTASRQQHDDTDAGAAAASASASAPAAAETRQETFMRSVFKKSRSGSSATDHAAAAAKSTTSASAAASSAADDDDDWLPCGVCFNDFQYFRTSFHIDHRPVQSLTCPHTLCVTCVKGMWSKLLGPAAGSCPFCREGAAFPPSKKQPRFNQLTMRLLRQYLEGKQEKEQAKIRSSNVQSVGTQTGSSSANPKLVAKRQAPKMRIATSAAGVGTATTSSPKDPPGTMFHPPTTSSLGAGSTVPAIHPTGVNFQLGRPPENDEGIHRTRKYGLRCGSKPRTKQAPRSVVPPAVQQPNDLPENANAFFQLMLERRWEEALKHGMDHPTQVASVFTANGIQVTSLHAAIYFGAPVHFIRTLVHILPSAVSTPAMREGEYLLPVDWATKMGRSDLVELLQPPPTPSAPGALPATTPPTSTFTAEESVNNVDASSNLPPPQASTEPSVDSATLSSSESAPTASVENPVEPTGSEENTGANNSDREPLAQSSVNNHDVARLIDSVGRLTVVATVTTSDAAPETATQLDVIPISSACTTAAALVAASTEQPYFPLC